MNKLTLCILRVSTDRQTTDLQRHALGKEIRERNLHPIELEQYLENKEGYSEYPNLCIMVEDKASGRSDARRGYRWALGMVKGGWVSATITYRADRLGRSLKNNLEFADACLSTKTELYSLKDKVDLTSASGKLMYSVLSAAAQYQSDVYSENVKEGIATARANATAELKKELGRSPTKEELNAKYHHGGTSKGWTYRRTLKLLPRMFAMVEAGLSNHQIRFKLGLNYRTIRKYRALGKDAVLLTRRQMNSKFYKSSKATI